MKKQTRKLVLAKETVRNLGDLEPKGVVGGITMSLCAKVCDSWYDCNGPSSPRSNCC